MNTQHKYRIVSPLSGDLTEDGVSVDILVWRDPRDAAWSMEVHHAERLIIRWTRAFFCDDQAIAEFRDLADNHGIRAFQSCAS